MRAFWFALAILLAPLFLIYILAGIASPLIRFGCSRRGRGAKMFLAKDLIHADYVFESADWADLFEPRGRYIRVGWGDRRIFLETRTWGELKAKDFITAFFGLNPTVLRVEYLNDVPSGSKEMEVGAGQVEIIKSHVRRSFRGAPVGRRAEDYQGGEFYDSDLRYNCVTNCNNWVNRGMFLAGVTNRVWCPLSFWL